jgi:hypothetical protein
MHHGTGSLPLAPWWLAICGVVEDERLAAQAPAMTTDRAKMRIASFMIGNLDGILIDRKIGFLHS